MDNSSFMPGRKGDKRLQVTKLLEFTYLAFLHRVLTYIDPPNSHNNLKRCVL